MQLSTSLRQESLPAARHAAQNHKKQLELQLANLQLSLEQEKIEAKTSKEELQQSLEQLLSENCQLKEELTLVTSVSPELH